MFEKMCCMKCGKVFWYMSFIQYCPNCGHKYSEKEIKTLKTI